MSVLNFDEQSDRFKDLLPDFSYLNKISEQFNVLSKYQNALDYSHLFPDNYLSVQARMLEQTGLYTFANSLNQLSLPVPDLYINKFSDIADQYSRIAESLNLSFLNEIQLTSKSIQDTIDLLYPKFDKFFQFEDIYKSSYSNLYSSIDNNYFSLQLDVNAPFQIDVVDKSSGNQYPLSNQKDVIGLTELFKSITQDESLDFISFISKYPYLSSMHKTGNKIINELENISPDIIEKINNLTLFRGRPWIEDQEMEYSTNEMWQPPYGYPDIGRFNPLGITYLYMSDSITTSKDELKDQIRFSIMEVVLDKEISILDISKQNCYIFELCNKKRSGSNLNPKEYYLPNYIAQCCAFLEKEKQIKIEGIKYKSSISADGYCYVFFNKYKDSFCNEKMIKNCF